MTLLGILSVVVGLICCIVGLRKDIGEFYFLGAVLLIFGIVTVAAAPPRERTIQATSVQIDTVYVVSKEKTDTTYTIHYYTKD